jgi:Histidine kinase
MNKQTLPQAAFVREHFHPLEIIPFFRRFRRSLARDIFYTFIWSCAFGLFFYAMGAFTAGQIPSLAAFGYYLAISNIIGYSIHILFSIGNKTRLDCTARNAGIAARVLYYAGIPLLGVVMGMWIASRALTNVNFGDMFTDIHGLLTLAAVSIAISFALTVVFFWRERGAVADAALARERERSERIERESVTANLRALQAQIEPHFLFNTLANVTSLIDADPAKAKHMLESFIRFLRASLAATRMESTTIAAEADLIASYLEVLQVRMGQRLCGRIEVDAALRPFTLPPMLLQPIVENAIRHGLEPKLEGGEIRVVARRDGGQVAIDVIDTGVGFASTTVGGLGLTNIRERLKLLYGKAASLEIRDHEPSGTIVTLRLPGSAGVAQ